MRSASHPFPVSWQNILVFHKNMMYIMIHNRSYYDSSRSHEVHHGTRR